LDATVACAEIVASAECFCDRSLFRASVRLFTCSPLNTRYPTRATANAEPISSTLRNRGSVAWFATGGHLLAA
jgi:hypothetical protein